MSLVNLTGFSGITDGANASPSYLNSKFSQLESMITTVNSSATDFGAVTSGSTTTFPVGAVFVLNSVDSGGFGHSLKAFAPSSSTDWTTALRSALSASNGGGLLIPPGNYYLSSTVTLSRQVKMLGIGGQGTTSFYKTHTGNMFDVTVANVEMHNIDLEADTTTSAATSGWAIRITGGAAVGNFKFLGGAINSFNSCIRFDDNSGSGSMIDNARIAPFTAVTAGEGVAISVGDDTAATQRFFSNINTPGGFISLASVADIFLTNSQVKRVDTATNSFGVHTNNCRYGNSGSTVTFAGDSCFHMGNSISGDCVLDSGFDGAFIGNVRTGYNLVDNTGSSGVIVIDHQLWKVPSTATFNLGGSRLKSIRTLAFASLTSANIMDQELVVGFGASGASLAYRSSGTVWYIGSSVSTNG